MELPGASGASWHCPQNLTAFGAPDYDLVRFLEVLVLSRLQTGAPGAVSGCAVELGHQRFSIDVIRRRFRLPHMIKSGSTPRLPAIGQRIQFLVRLKWLLSLAIAVVVTVAA